MFGKVGQLLVPFLLASTLPQDKSTNYAPSLKEIKTGMDQMYQDLVDQPGSVTKRLSPTLQFSYVSPPDINGTSTWRSSSSGSSASSSSSTSEVPPQDQSKPIVIYLPGLDGTGISAFNHQFDDMAQAFELWRLIIDTQDRSEFRQLLAKVVGFVEELSVNNTDREVVLVGESFGGVLASAVALNLQKRQESRKGYSNPLKGLCLVNPATAFHETNWDTIVPLLASLQYLGNRNTNQTTNTTPTPYSVAGGMALSYLMPDNDQLGRIGEVVMSAAGNVDPMEAVEDMMSLLGILEERLPADTLKHRVNQWLAVSTNVVNARLKDLQLPTLVVAGDQDKIVPSDKEIKRLKQVIPSCETLLVRGRGHFVLDENVNLT